MDGMNKLPLKYQGVTEGEWRIHHGEDMRSWGHIRCDKEFAGPNGVAVARANRHSVGYSEAVANCSLMADSKRLAGAVVELREALERLLDASKHSGESGYYTETELTDPWGSARESLTQTAEWAA